MDAPPSSPSPDRSPRASDAAARWLAAAAARIEDDPALLDALSEADVATLLAAEGGGAAGVAAGVRRRLREAERARPAPRWRWPAAAGALALAAMWAVFALRPTGPDAVDAVLTYRTELAVMAGPRVKGAAPRAAAAEGLLAAAEASPPDTARARRAADAFAEAADVGPAGESAFFAALAYRLAGDAEAAERWARQIPPESPYADAIRTAR